MKRFGTRIKSFKKPPLILKKLDEIPENFHYTADQLLPPQDQGQCGSCWSHSIVSSIANRIAIYTNGKTKILLSPQQLMDCCKNNAKGCDGAEVESVCEELKSTGLKIVPRSLYPYEGKNDTCKTVQSDYTVSVADYFPLCGDIQTIGSDTHLKYIENIKTAIIKHGPVSACMEVYKSFMDYDGLTIYEKKPDETVPEGGHAIIIVGYGKTPDGIDYWVCRNSWGATWPPKYTPIYGPGVFFMKMGVNSCSIEELAFSIIPKVTGQNIDTTVIPTPEEASEDGYYDTDAHRFRRHRVDPNPTPDPSKPILVIDLQMIKDFFTLLAIAGCIFLYGFLVYKEFNVVLTSLILVVVTLSSVFFLQEKKILKCF